MATVSFDDKVIVTDPKVVSEMKADLESTSPVVWERKSNTKRCTIQMAEENAKNWVLK